MAGVVVVNEVDAEMFRPSRLSYCCRDTRMAHAR